MSSTKLLVYKSALALRLLSLCYLFCYSFLLIKIILIYQRGLIYRRVIKNNEQSSHTALRHYRQNNFSLSIIFLYLRAAASMFILRFPRKAITVTKIRIPDTGHFLWFQFPCVIKYATLLSSYKIFAIISCSDEVKKFVYCFHSGK